MNRVVINRPTSELALRRLSGILGGLVFAGGALILIGWGAGVVRLREWAGDGIATKPNSAIWLMSVGAGLLVLAVTARRVPSAAPTIAAEILGGVAALLGALTIVEHLTGWSFGIDTLLFDEAVGARATAAPGRMGLPASTSAVLLGTGLIISSATRRAAFEDRRFWPRSMVSVFAITAASIGFVPIWGFLFGVSSLYEIPRLTGIAFGTACMIFAASVALVVTVPDREPTRALRDGGAAGVIARRALPLIVVLPFLGEWLRARGEAAHLFGPDLGRMLVVLAPVALFSVLLWWVVKAIRSREGVLRLAEEERNQIQGVKARLAAIVESSDDAVISKDLNGVITSWNASAERLFGYSETEAVGRPVTMLIPADRHDEEPMILARLRRGDRVEHFETVRRRKDGSLIDLSLSISPIRNAAGEVVGASKIARDITARKRAEEALRESEDRFRVLLKERTAELQESLGRLHDAERLVALGNLAAGIGHDIANMILPIRARLEPLAQACTTEDGRSDIEAIGQSLMHLTSLSAGLRLMALDPGRNQASTEATDLEHWWSEAEGVMRASLARSIALESDVQPGLGVRMPRHQLTQVVFNLVRNAGEAIGTSPGGVVRLEARATGGEAKPEVAISIIDNGHGLSPEALARCFEPYFSTKGRSIATGMGLAMVRGLVESAGGSVSVRSQREAGAKFTLTLPAASPPRRNAALSQRRTRTAAISMSDARMAALATMMLEGLEVSVSTHNPSGVPDGPDADLWVAQDPESGMVDAFIRRDDRRRAVVFTSSDPVGSADRPSRDRVCVVRLPVPPSLLRDALSSAVGVLSPNGADP